MAPDDAGALDAVAATAAPPATAAMTAELVRRAVIDQLAPALALHADLVERWTLGMDVDVARRRLENGQVAFDPMEVIGGAGNLLVPYVRATVALERSGLSTDDEAVQARERRFQLLPLIAAWLSAEPPPRDRVRSVARRAASLVASSILCRASREVRAGASLAGWGRTACPCCGAAPDFSLGACGARTLVCARCDTSWTTTAAGCLGCGARNAPTIAHVQSESIGYRLTICNSCGRYIKEPMDGRRALPVLVERALTAQLDAAAESRGLRL